MSLPEVCCVMLADGRHDMVRRAVDSFARQDYYGQKRLLIWDTSADHGAVKFTVPITHFIMSHQRGMTIGQLRNEANSQVHEPIILHWDSDDWSYPGRITEQVGLLWATDYTAVGYNDMMFWDSRPWKDRGVPEGCGIAGAWERGKPGEAWLYRNPNPRWCLGTSLCYLRSAWERSPFPNTSKGEDNAWIRSQNVKAVSSVNRKSGTPAMIASVHGDNTCSVIQPGFQEWRRVSEFDMTCREIMEACR